jgi:outer membrane immunogenic protein
MNKTLAMATVTAVMATAGSALAADLHAPLPVRDEPVYEQRSRWQGFYLGLNGGYAFGDTSNAPFEVANVPVRSLGDLSPEGGFGGGQIGFNVVSGRVLFGAEADLQGADINDSTRAPGLGAASSDVDMFGTVRGRLGFVSDRTLFYVTGGYAWGDVESTFSTGGLTLSQSEILHGFVLGGGVEYALTDNWSTKLEYQYVDLEDSRLGIGARSTSIDPDFHTVRLGVNYRF